MATAATAPTAPDPVGAMTTEPQHSDRVRYRFSPLERRGVIAGWRGGQIASVASSLVVGMLALARARRWLGWWWPWSASAPVWPWRSVPSRDAPGSSGCLWCSVGRGRRHRGVDANWQRPLTAAIRPPSPPPDLIHRRSTSDRRPWSRPAAAAGRVFDRLRLVGVPVGRGRGRSGDGHGDRRTGPYRHRGARRTRSQFRSPRPARSGLPDCRVGPGALGHGPGGIRCPPGPMDRVLSTGRRARRSTSLGRPCGARSRLAGWALVSVAGRRVLTGDPASSGADRTLHPHRPFGSRRALLGRGHHRDRRRAGS